MHPASEQYTTSLNPACTPVVQVDGTSQYLPAPNVCFGMSAPARESLYEPEEAMGLSKEVAGKSERLSEADWEVEVNCSRALLYNLSSKEEWRAGHSPKLRSGWDINLIYRIQVITPITWPSHSRLGIPGIRYRHCTVRVAEHTHHSPFVTLVYMPAPS